MAESIRDWARKNGFQVGQRGRMKPEITAAYAKAHDKTVEIVKQEVKESKPVIDRLQEYRAHAAQRRFQEWWGAADTRTRNVRDCCVDCQTSIGWCPCAVPKAFARDNETVVELYPVDGPK